MLDVYSSLNHTCPKFVMSYELGVAMNQWTDCLRREPFRDTLRTIAQFHRRGRVPLIRDVVAELNCPHTTLLYQVEKLQSDGYIYIEGGKNQPKMLALTEMGEKASQVLGARVLGSIAAGPLRFVPDTDGVDSEGAPIFRQSWDDVLPCTEKYASIMVKGDSMIGDGIFEGDEVHLRTGRKISDLQEGEIAAVMVGEDYEATLKHVFFDPQTRVVTLRASNPAYEDIMVPVSQVRLVGTWRGIVRLNPLEVSRK
ncbi:MAG: hypothetical protein EOP09_13310 [Proteobacteria bacterium]|nr:MAG: hypothetical protein EOP09_13310 [Pseudomonadota bacterium]